MIHILKTFIELVCKYMVNVIIRTDRASNAEISSEISVDVEVAMAHIEAAANMFWRVLFPNPKKEKR